MILDKIKSLRLATTPITKHPAKRSIICGGEMSASHTTRLSRTFLAPDRVPTEAANVRTVDTVV